MSTEILKQTTTTAVIEEIQGKTTKLKYLDSVSRPDLCNKTVIVATDKIPESQRKIGNPVIVHFSGKTDLRFMKLIYTISHIE